MKVSLISFDKNWLAIVATAAKTSHSSESPEQLLVAVKNEPVEKTSEYVLRVFRSGHESILEHASFVFTISGVSRTLSHQLVRHRIASFTQQSQRYVNFSKAGGCDIVLPPSIRANEEALSVFNSSIDQSVNSYDKLIALGIKPEDARFVFPNAAATNLVMTMNLRELLHFFILRLDQHAQWEIRGMAYKMVEALKAIENGELIMTLVKEAVAMEARRLNKTIAIEAI